MDVVLDDHLQTTLHVMEALGGPRERLRSVQAGSYDLGDVQHPVCVGLKVAGTGAVMPLASRTTTAKIVERRAPSARSMAISRRRSFIEL